MNEVIEIIVNYVAMWAPALTAVGGVILTVIGAINKTNAAITDLRNTKDFSELKTQLTTALSQNKELCEQNKLLLDQITKIQGYVDEMKNKNGGE